jgi:nitrogen regulatory protein P-II 1
VHRNRIAAVISALKASPSWPVVSKGRQRNLAIYMVKGSLVPLDSDELNYSMDLGDAVVSEYKLELLCEDAEVDDFVSVIRTAAHTGQPNAGWIYVLDIADAFPIN